MTPQANDLCLRWQQALLCLTGIIYKNTKSIRAFVHYWNSVLHGSILCKYLLNEWMSKRIQLLVRLSLERKTLCCPQNVFAPWLGHLHSELPIDGISTGWDCQFPNSRLTMGHRSLLLLIAGLRITKKKKWAMQTLHNAGKPFFPPPLLPSQAPKVLTSVRQRGSNSLSRCSLPKYFCETPKLWLFCFNLKLKNWEKATIKCLKVCGEVTHHLVIQVLFSQMHKQKCVKPELQLPYWGRSWVTWRQIKLLHSGNFFKLKHSDL